ncbi:MAG: response regulator transcription factor [Lachnospira sp.]|nr:response regulator transcription factor [Lachnospira sp.]
MYRILLVEDDDSIREVIYDYFMRKDKDGFSLTLAKDGNQAEEALYEQDYDLILLDVMLPGTDGFTLCRTIRLGSSAPVIFLTARGREEDRLYGYVVGCDDYMVKPFSLAELYAKVQALIKRSKGMVLCQEIKVADISLNPRQMTVSVAGKQIELTPKLYALLKYLMEHKNEVAAREELLVRIWGYDFEGSDRVVDNHIKKLRKALGESGSRIKTVIGKGYKLTE